MNSASAGSSSASSSAATGGASSGPSGTPTSLDAQARTDESIGYYVDFVPQGLDAPRPRCSRGSSPMTVLRGRHIGRWTVTLSAVEASTTGTALESYCKSYSRVRDTGEHEAGTARMTVNSVEMQSGSEAVIDVCADQTQIKRVSSSGEEIPRSNGLHTYSDLVSVKLTDGVWKVASLERTGKDIC